MRKIFVCFLLLYLCSDGISQRPRADLVIQNAKIHTVDDQNPKAQALAIKGNRIIAVGKNRRIRRFIGRTTKLINARNRLVVPGFNDAHVHLAGIGNLYSSLDLRGIKNRGEIGNRIAEAIRFVPKGRWILGGGWDQSKWVPANLPSKQLIDAVSPNNPVFLYDHDAKMALANSLALRLAGIDKTPNKISGGKIERDARGEPTGILRGNAMFLVKTHIPKFASQNWHEVLETATNYAASLGVTSVQDMHSDDLYSVLNALDSEGKLKTRVYDCTPLIAWKKLADSGIKRANGTAMVRNGCLKSSADTNPESAKILLSDIVAADKAGLQIMIHSIGRSSNRSILRAFVETISRNGKKDRRLRVEHARSFFPEDVAIFGQTGIVASLEPHLFYGGDPYRTLLKTGAKIAFGSDASITDLNPMYGIYAAVKYGRPEERLTVKEAVRLYTLGSAYAEFQDEVKGSIAAGKLADLVILSDDIFSIDVEKIKKTRVFLTIVDGKIVYRSPN